MSTRYFRAGVGTVIYNNDNQVAFFERHQHPAEIWQFQQGGMDHGEIAAETLWRELKEEVGLEKTAIEGVIEYPEWVSYEDLNASTDATIPRIGQIHRWFFLKLKTDSEIDLTKATDDEFKNWKWVSFEEAISCTAPHKQHVYERLHAHFKMLT